MKDIEREVDNFKDNVKKLSEYVSEVESLKLELDKTNSNFLDVEELKQDFQKLMEEFEVYKSNLTISIEHLNKDVNFSVKETEIIKIHINKINEDIQRNQESFKDVVEELNFIKSKIAVNETLIKQNLTNIDSLLKTVEDNYNNQRYHFLVLLSLNVLLFVALIILKFYIK